MKKSKISITTPVYDMEGSMKFEIEPDSDISGSGRRVTRTATLDEAGADFEDLGSKEADKTFEIIARGLTRDQYTQLQTMVELYPLLNIVTDTGAYSGAVEKINNVSGVTTFTFLVKEKL